MNGHPTPDKAWPMITIQYHASGGVELMIKEDEDKQHKSPPMTVNVAPI